MTEPAPSPVLPAFDVERLRVSAELRLSSSMEAFTEFAGLREALAPTSPDSLRPRLMAEAVRLSEAMAPDTWSLAHAARRALRLERPMEIYLSSDRERAAVHAIEEPVVLEIPGRLLPLLDRGATVFEPEEPIGMYRFHPRTAIGSTPGGATLVIAVVDGRRNGIPGMTSLGLIPLMEEFGVSDAINLDGGGSTELYIAAEGGVVNRPSDGVERRVGNHLGIRVVDP